MYLDNAVKSLNTSRTIQIPYEHIDVEKIDVSEVVDLVEFSTKMAQEELTIELQMSDQGFEGISTDVATADPAFVILDEIIEKFNAQYDNAKEELREIVDTLSNDNNLRQTVSNSSPSAYEAIIDEKFSENINNHIIDGIMTDNTPKAEYYTALSKDDSTKKQIRNSIIRKIKDWLNLNP